MSPLIGILQWFRSQPSRMQEELTFWMLHHLVDDLDYVSSDMTIGVGRLVEWLLPAGELPFREVGKAITFAAVVDHVGLGRFTAEGWAARRALDEREIERAEARGIDSLAKMMRDGLPRRHDEERVWLALGESWAAFRSAHLDPAGLDRWALSSFGPSAASAAH